MVVNTLWGVTKRSRGVRGGGAHGSEGDAGDRRGYLRERHLQPFLAPQALRNAERHFAPTGMGLSPLGTRPARSKVKAELHGKEGPA